MTDQELKKQIATRLRLAREQAGLSQGQVAKELNYHRPTISEIEAGRRSVSAEELRILSDLYDIQLDWLLGKNENSDFPDDRVFLAARELSKLKTKDFDRLMGLLNSLKKNK